MEEWNALMSHLREPECIPPTSWTGPTGPPTDNRTPGPTSSAVSEWFASWDPVRTGDSVENERAVQKIRAALIDAG